MSEKTIDIYIDLKTPRVSKYEEVDSRIPIIKGYKPFWVTIKYIEKERNCYKATEFTRGYPIPKDLDSLSTRDLNSVMITFMKEE